MPLRSGCRSLAWGSPYLAGLSALAVEVGHLQLRVALARGGTGRHGLLYGGEVGLIESDVQRAERLGQPSRRRAPTSGTMSSPRERTQAMAICATVTPFCSAILCRASTRSRLCWRFSP